MKVLISGAGPAGLTAAHWLRRYGYSPTIVERAPSLVVGGYKIDVRGAALQVLRQMGVHDAVVAARVVIRLAQCFIPPSLFVTRSPLVLIVALPVPRLLSP